MTYKLFFFIIFFTQSFDGMQDLSKEEKSPTKYKKFWGWVHLNEFTSICNDHSINPQTEARLFYFSGADKLGRHEIILLAPATKEAALRADKRIDKLRLDV